LSNSIHLKSSTCLRKWTFDDIFRTLMEVHFRAQHLRKSPLFYGSHYSLTKITHLLRKSLSTTEVTFNYRSQFKLRKSTSNTNGLRKSTSSGVIFMLFIVVYRSPLPKFILDYGSPLPSSCGLRKSTSEIKSLANVDFRFVVFVSDMDTHIYIL